MYAYIHGRLDQIKTDSVIVEAGGVGYRLLTAPSVMSRLPQVNSDVRLYTHFIVREDAHTLYGFLTRDELGMFETLLTVSGVGPKAALSLISTLQPSQFGLAVLTEDFKMLSRAQGVGAKLAQKIVFELRDKMKKELSVAGDGGDAQTGIAYVTGASPVDRGKFGEAVEAMIVLGCSAAEANGVVSRVYAEEQSLEEIIRGALLELGR
jgi:Holliday junction DNA helicase RuvA